MFNHGGIRGKLIWGVVLTVVGMLGVLLPVALASTSGSTGAPTAGSAHIRAAAADATTATDTTTTDTTDTTDTSTTDTSDTSTSVVVVTGDEPTVAVGQQADVDYSTGTVLVKVPGTTGFVNLSSLQQLPIGSVIDATDGLIKLTFALPNATTQTATFWKGEFTVAQTSSGAVNLTLTGSSFAGCPRPPAKAKTKHRKPHLASAAKAKKKGTKVRSLWANASGSFKTTGNNGAAAVLGTEWLTIDQCDGTYFYVKKASNDPLGRIRVTVFHPHRHTVLLTRGHFLLAPAAGYP